MNPTDELAQDPARKLCATEIGARIAARRTALSMTQVGLAMRAGVEPTGISRIENGHVMPMLKTVESLAICLEVPIEHLLYGRPIPGGQLQ